ncbi:MAG: hypothetical protein AB1742_11165, partial [bacterium]
AARAAVAGTSIKTAGSRRLMRVIRWCFTYSKEAYARGEQNAFPAAGFPAEAGNLETGRMSVVFKARLRFIP